MYICPHTHTHTRTRTSLSLSVYIHIHMDIYTCTHLHYEVGITLGALWCMYIRLLRKIRFGDYGDAGNKFFKSPKP